MARQLLSVDAFTSLDPSHKSNEIVNRRPNRFALTRLNELLILDEK